MNSSQAQRLPRCKKEADMFVKLPKTFTQIVQTQPKVGAATKEEIAKVQASYPVPCDFAGAGCDARFKTKRAMYIHRNNCNYNYNTSEKPHEVKEIVGVYGRTERKLFKVSWAGCPGQDSWVPEHLLLRDNCAESIEDFWANSNTNPALNFFKDPNNTPRCWMCGWSSSKKNKVKGLKAHIRLRKHKWAPARAQLCERKDIKQAKLTAQQEQFEHVYWGEEKVRNCWHFIYLGSCFQPDGNNMTDVRMKTDCTSNNESRRAAPHLGSTTTSHTTQTASVYLSGMFDTHIWCRRLDPRPANSKSPAGRKRSHARTHHRPHNP